MASVPRTPAAAKEKIMARAEVHIDALKSRDDMSA